MKYKFFGFFILFFILVRQVSLAQSALDISRIKTLLLNPKQSQTIPDLQKKHPDYPITVILQAHRAEQNNNAEDVLKLIEPLREQVFYFGIEKSISESKRKLEVGTLAGFRPWREFAYILLGRAYYKLGWYRQAIEAFSGIPDNSPLYSFAYTDLVWSHLAANEIDLAEKTLSEFRENLHKDNIIKIEIKLQRALLYIRQNKFQESIKITAPIINMKSNPLHPREQVLAFKIFAEAGFRFWLENSNKWGFKESIKNLTKVIDASKSIKKTYCDSECVFFIAEAHWNLASLYRIEDPVKYENTWKSSLKTANDWLTPLVGASLKTMRATVKEDAFFLSIAVLWEQGKQTQALPRIHAFSKLYPQGRYREDIYQLVADYYFEKGQFTKAIENYRELVKIAEYDKAAYGVYKAAWAFYNIQKQWEALRHMERIVLHYKPSDSNERQTSINKEARRDMLLFMAELLNSEKALEELKIFNYEGREKIEAWEQLAFTYKKIGKFDYSCDVFEKLLKDNNQNLRAYDWLGELSDNHLRSGQRRKISQAVETYFPNLPTEKTHSTDEITKAKNIFLSRLANINLTIHKEGRKTDDPEIWLAVDDTYRVFNKYFPESKIAKVWYHGAQRLEQRGMLWDAVVWYKRAAEIHGFENSQDAAISVLSIIKSQTAALSLKKNYDVAEYKKITDSSFWFIKTFPNTPQRHLADHVYLESLQKIGQMDTTINYLKELFSGGKNLKENIEKFQNVKARFYHTKNWQEIFKLSQAIIPSVPDGKDKNVKDFINELMLSSQESAFQAAFKSKDDKKLLREWYLNAIKTSYKKDITLKSWYNLLLSYALPEEIDNLLGIYKDYTIDDFKDYKPHTEEAGLMAGIELQIAKAYNYKFDDVKRADKIISSLRFREKSQENETERWIAAITYANYYESEKFLDQIHILEKFKSQILNDINNQIYISYLLFWNQKLDTAWAKLKPILEKKEVPPDAYLLLRDLFYYSKNEDSSIFNAVSAWLKQRQEALIKTPPLISVWAHILHPDFNIDEIDDWKNLSKPNESYSDNPVEDLEARVDIVKKTFTQLDEKISNLDSLLKSRAPQIQAQTSCLLPVYRQNAVISLKNLKEPAINELKQWGEFEKKLDSRILEFETSLKKEVGFCKKQLDVAVYLLELDPNSACIWDKCLKDSTPSISDLIDIKSKIENQNINLADKVYKYLEVGAYPLAEMNARSAENIEERYFLFGLIRLAHNDTWNASSLFKEAVKAGGNTSQSNLLLANTALANKNFNIAKNLLHSVNEKNLNEWQKALFDKINARLE